MPQLKFHDLRRHSWRDSDGVETVSKPRDSVESYTLDWSDDLASNETISSSAWEYSGVQGSGEADTDTSTSAVITQSDGVATNTITTSDGRTLVHVVRFIGVV